MNESCYKPPRCYYCGASHQPEGGPLLHTQVPIIERGVVARLLKARICDDCAWADAFEPDDPDAHDHYPDVSDRNAGLPSLYPPRY